MSNYLTENLRTVALVGHSASGKTSLVEAMLVRTGAIAEAGSVERGNTVCDNDPQEKAVGHSLRMAVAHIDTAMPDLTPVRIHVIDTPGALTTSVRHCPLSTPSSPLPWWLTPPRALN